jgi:hypothetical protein
MIEIMQNRSCLIVDDSPVVRRAARRIVEGFGFTVREAKDGAEALASCRSEMPEAVLLDWNMPVMDGLEFLKHCRAEHGLLMPGFCTINSCRLACFRMPREFSGTCHHDGTGARDAVRRQRRAARHHGAHSGNRSRHQDCASRW